MVTGASAGPRVGDAAWGAVYERVVPESYRIVNDRDVVPQGLPLDKGRSRKGVIQPAIDPDHRSGVSC